MASLPIFPLGTVLMPGDQLPLQIFEPRYVALLRDLVAHQDQQDPVFGVVAIKKGFEVGQDGVSALHPVGCAALLTRAAELGEQKYVVVCEGTRRFTVDALDATAGTPYTTAEVTWLGEPDGDPDLTRPLAARLRGELAAYRKAIGEQVLTPPEGDRELSYWLPQAITLDLADRQLLLSSSDTGARLRLGLQLVHREHVLATSLGTVPRPPAQARNLN